MADIRNSFHRFAKLLPKDGTLVINDNIPDLEEITADLDCRVIRYGNDSSLDYSVPSFGSNFAKRWKELRISARSLKKSR